MKKFFTVFIFSVICFYSQSALRSTILNPNVSGNIISIMLGKNDNQIRTLTMHIDNNGKYFLGSSTKTTFLGGKMFDDSYLDNFQYGCLPGKHIFVKLDNDTILKLTCETILFEELKWEWCSDYRNKTFSGNVISLFKLNDTNIELLKTHKITKMRFEESIIWDVDKNVSFETFDTLFIYQLNKTYEIYNKYLNNKQKKIQEYQEQKILKENPLYNF